MPPAGPTGPREISYADDPQSRNHSLSWYFGRHVRSKRERGLSSPASLLSVADSGEPIVGFWKVTFTSEGTPDIPDGTVIDQAYSQWHSDGTEIMNSSRPPVTQSFCLGVWKKVGGLCYKLNHFAISYACSESATALPWDPNNNLVGPGNIREEVALSPTGKKFNARSRLTNLTKRGTHWST